VTVYFSVTFLRCLKEPKKKRRSSLAKVTSLAGFLSPVPPVKKVGSSLQVSTETHVHIAVTETHRARCVVIAAGNVAILHLHTQH